MYMKRTPSSLEKTVMERVLKGDLYAHIARDTGLGVSTIKKIKKRNLEAYRKAKFEDRLNILYLIKKQQISLIREFERRLKRSDELSITELMKIASAAADIHYANSYYFADTDISSPLKESAPSRPPVYDEATQGPMKETVQDLIKQLDDYKKRRKERILPPK